MKWKDLHAWNKCSIVSPIFEYCCLKCVCKVFQSKAIGLSNWYHNLASPSKVKQSICNLTPSENAWVPIQLLVLRRCVCTSSSGFFENSGLKWDQFNYGIGPGCTGGAAGCTGGKAGSAGDTGGCTGGARQITGIHMATEGGWGTGGPPTPICIYVLYKKECLTLNLL